MKVWDRARIKLATICKIEVYVGKVYENIGNCLFEITVDQVIRTSSIIT